MLNAIGCMTQRGNECISIYSDLDLPTPEDDLQEARDTLEKEKERLQALRLQLARKNRAIVSIERQLDNIPDRTELAQYQRRFIELYVQGANPFWVLPLSQLLPVFSSFHLQ